MTSKDETKIPSRVSGIEWAVVNFSKLLLETDDKKNLFWKSLELTG